ncbi:hypothetical protein BV22DRAFT_1127392 [Leucogyrophana mollusca]|uniref:Uncharacterized protein n=1 Tax=Leucogyrophana mollusca TaxID=85980 RepID=A0ACB8BPD3_9AGAM|nr:hypothetical protein BV22DRAFT_1127392 [Leucogyrophana mollusca]
MTDPVGLQTSKYFNVAAAAVLIFDYCVTFEAEVRLTWGRKWGPPRILFVLSRYVPFAGALMTAYAAANSHETNCAPFGDVSSGARSLSIIFAECLLILRTYAFWGRSKRFLAVLLTYSVATLAAAIIVSAAPINLNNPGQSLLCTFEGARSSAIPYGLLMLYEMVIMSLIIFKRYRHYHDASSAIIKTLYRDGMLYTLSIMLVSAANVIVDASLPLAYSDMLDTPQVVAHSVLASRILFNLQESNDRLDELSGAEDLEPGRIVISRPVLFQEALHINIPA